MPADDRRTLLKPELARDHPVDLLDLDPRGGHGGYSAAGCDFGSVSGALAAESALHPGGERGDEGVDLLNDEGALARAGLHQASADEPLHRVANGVPGRLILVPQLDFRRQLVARAKLAGLDLPLEIIGDQPVHGFRHAASRRLSERSQPHQQQDSLGLPGSFPPSRSSEYSGLKPVAIPPTGCQHGTRGWDDLDRRTHGTQTSSPGTWVHLDLPDESYGPQPPGRRPATSIGP